MPDDLDRFLAEQGAQEEAELAQHADRRERRLQRSRPRAPDRDRGAVVAELEAGSDEIDALANAIGPVDDVPT